MGQINSKQTGRGTFTQMQTTAAMILVAIWAIIVAGAYFSGASIYIVVIVMCIFAAIVGKIAIKYILDRTEFNKIVTRTSFRVRKRSGNTTISTYVLPIKKLKKHIPIEKVQDGGLIQYSKGEYGVLFRYDPKDVSKSEYEHYKKQMIRFVNSFGEDMEFSFHEFDMLERANPLKDQLLKQFNKEGTTLEQRRHLQDMYDTVDKRTADRVACKFLLAIKLGAFDTVEHAQKSYNSQIPGMLRLMREIGVPTMQMINENEVAIAFREFATMEEI